MILCGNGVLCWQVLLAVLYLVDGYELLHDHDRINWTSAADTYTADDNLLARIKSIEELCAAQAEIGNNSNSGYWTALKLNSNGSYQWGHLATSTPNITEELLDRTQPLDRCYVINKSAMKLLSKDCNSLQGVLLSQKDDEANSDDSGYKRLLEHFSYGCIEYELSKCSNLSDSTKQEVPQPWPCKQSNGMSYGSRQVEDAILNCCRTYCRVDHDAYSIDTASGIETKVKKVPKGYSKDVEIRFNTSGNNEENREVKVIIAAQVFNSTERVLAVLLHRTTCDQEFELTNTGNFVLYSDVVAVVLKPNHTDIIPNKVIIYFSHNKPNQGILERKCVFWKEDLNSWSSEGCTVFNSSSPERTICSCDHLTNFAVLMQFKDVSPKHKVMLLVITYIGCALSLAGEVLTVFVYVIFMKFKAEGIQIRINLAIALFLAQVVFLSGIDATNNKSGCVLVAVLLHYLYLASFGWMLLEGVFLYIMIVEVFSTVNVRYLYLFAWGYPVIPVVISLAIGAESDGGLQNYTNENFCWLSFYKHLSWAFIAPVLLVTLINFGILLAVLREIRNLHEPNPSKMKTFKKSLKSFVTLTPLLGLTWVFGLLTVTDAGLVFQYIFTILNSTQGMLIFLLHVLRNSEVRTAFHHKLLKWRFDRFYNSTSVNRVQGDASQSKGKRKRQIDPEESNNKELHRTRQSGEQMALSVQVSTPAASSGSVTL